MPAGGLSPINRALNLVPKRADQSQAHRLADTFVDSGVSAALEAIDHQVVYGRRGTGKTHALRFLEASAQAQGDTALYLDLRTIGSPAGLFGVGDVPATERTARLLVDMLTQLHDELLSTAVNDHGLLGDEHFVAALDRLAASITTVRVSDQVEVERSGESSTSRSSGSGFGRDRQAGARAGRLPRVDAGGQPPRGGARDPARHRAGGPGVRRRVAGAARRHPRPRRPAGVAAARRVEQRADRRPAHAGRVPGALRAPAAAGHREDRGDRAAVELHGHGQCRRRGHRPDDRHRARRRRGRQPRPRRLHGLRAERGPRPRLLPRPALQAPDVGGRAGRRPRRAAVRGRRAPPGVRRQAGVRRAGAGGRGRAPRRHQHRRQGGDAGRRRAHLAGRRALRGPQLVPDRQGRRPAQPRRGAAPPRTGSSTT